MNHRIRLTDEERLYLMSLIERDNNISEDSAKLALLGKPIKRLLYKLGDTTYHGEKARIINYKEVSCDYCGRTMKSGAGLSRHMASKHSDRLVELSRLSKGEDA